MCLCVCLYAEPEPALAPQLKYYSSAVHAAAFVLPAFAEAVVAGVHRPPLPHVCSSVKTSMLNRSSLALAAAGVVVGAATAAAALVGRRK